MIKKNYSISGIDTASIQFIFFELYTIVGIINLPDEANITFKKFLKFYSSRISSCFLHNGKFLENHY